jgi:uncharacterized protein (TIRG00374 family)
VFLDAKRIKSTAFFLVKCGIAAALVIWLVRTGKLDFKALAAVRLGWAIVAVFVLQLLMLTLPLVRWFVIARSQKLELSLAKSFHIGFMGYFASLLLPSSLGMDGLRVLYLCRNNKGREHAAVSTVIVDRIIGAFGLLVLGTAFGVVLLWQNSSNVVLQRIVLFLAGVLVSSVVLLAVLFHPRAKIWVRPFYKWKVLGTFMDALGEYRHQKAALAKSLALSWGGHLSTCVAAYLAFRILGMPAPLLTVFAIIPMVNLSGIIPLTPLGLGVADSVAVALCSLVQIQGGAEVIMLLRGVACIWLILAGTAYLFPIEFRPRPGIAGESQPNNQQENAATFPSVKTES